METEVDPFITEIVGQGPRPLKQDPEEPPLSQQQTQVVDAVLECMAEAHKKLESLTVALRNVVTTLHPSTFIRLVECAAIPRV